MLPANRAVYHRGRGVNRNSTGGSRSNCAIDDRESRPVLMNIFYYLFNELAVPKREANMHNVTLGYRCGLVYIYAKGQIPALHNLQQRLPDFADANDDHSLVHSRNS